MANSENTYSERVSRLVGWGHWFTLFNIIAAMLIGIRYIIHSPWPDSMLGQAYLVFSWIGHFGFLVFAIYLLIIFPLTFIIPLSKLLRFLAVCIATLGLTILLIDTQAYREINLHLTPVVWELLFTDEGGTAKSDLRHLFVVLPFIFLIQLALSELVWNKQRKLSQKHIGRPIAAVFFVSFIVSHLIYVWSDAYFETSVTNQESNFPLSYPMTAKSFMEKHGLFDRDQYTKRLKETETDRNLVNYPLEPIQFSRRANGLNILLVSVNNLRSDVLTPDIMPNTYQFAEQNLSFDNHYSSSNDMFGIFGLFYGLPSNYASSIKNQKTPPILLSVLKKQKYRFAFFSGNNFNDPLYNNVIFNQFNISKLSFNDESSHDTQTIERWAEWVPTQSNQPWFSYLELTTVDKFNNFEASKSNNNTEERLRSAYNHSVSIADNELRKLFDKLDTLELMENTLVIITSNHGSEFNETKSNSWGANSNYSRYQLQVPLIIRWPGKVAGSYSHRSSHLDISVTLLQDLLGVSSNPSEFSSGRNLFNEMTRRWILAGDTRELALITSDQTTVLDKFGNFKLYDENYQRLNDASPTLPVLMQGLTELQRFYIKE